MSRLLVYASSGLEESDHLFRALETGLSGRAVGHEVVLYLTGAATRLAKPGYAETYAASVDPESAAARRPSIADLLEQYRASGGTLVIAQESGDRYGVSTDIIEGVEWQPTSALIAYLTDGYLPVLVITAQPGHKLRALKAGAKDFVSKPFDLVEVQTRIHNMLEVRLLYSKLADYNRVLEQTVLERTAQLRESEARFQRFTELSSDWYWEQDAQGKLTNCSGPVTEMLGIDGAGGWNAAERALLDANIASRRPFLDLVYSRVKADGATQYLQVSGEPMFDTCSRFIGYRGIGMDITERMQPCAAGREK